MHHRFYHIYDKSKKLPVTYMMRAIVISRWSSMSYFFTFLSFYLSSSFLIARSIRFSLPMLWIFDIDFIDLFQASNREKNMQVQIFPSSSSAIEYIKWKLLCFYAHQQKKHKLNLHLFRYETRTHFNCIIIINTKWTKHKVYAKSSSFTCAIVLL